MTGATSLLGLIDIMLCKHQTAPRELASRRWFTIFSSCHIRSTSLHRIVAMLCFGGKLTVDSGSSSTAVKCMLGLCVEWDLQTELRCAATSWHQMERNAFKGKTLDSSDMQNVCCRMFSCVCADDCLSVCLRKARFNPNDIVKKWVNCKKMTS